MPEARLTCADVSKSYGDRGPAVLRRVDAEFARGETVVIIGRSGSGKSTLLNLLGGLDEPTAGEVLFDGRSLSRISETERAMLRREAIGFVFQSFNLIPTLTVRENLLVPLQLNRIDKASSEARIRRLLSAAAIAACANRFPHELAGGEQQRAAILRAIIHEPPVVIADEPTGNLDLATARDTLDLLQEFCAQAGRTLIMATHSAAVIGRATRILEIHDGRLEPAGASSRR